MNPKDFRTLRGTTKDIDTAATMAESGRGGSRFRIFWDQVTACARMARASAKGDYPLATKEKALLLSGLAYVALPLDAVPDAVPGAGLVDDAVVIAGIVGALAWELNEFKKWESGRGPDDPGAPVASPVLA